MHVMHVTRLVCLPPDFYACQTTLYACHATCIPTTWLVCMSQDLYMPATWLTCQPHDFYASHRTFIPATRLVCLPNNLYSYHMTCMHATRLACLPHDLHACQMFCMYAAQLARRARPDIHQTISWAKLSCNFFFKLIFI